MITLTRLTLCAAATMAIGTASLFAGSAVALADGGQSIATATPVVYGQLEYGNTANGGVTTDGADGYESYWALNVTNGDDVTINWQAPLDISQNGPLLSAFEVGTNDANLEDASPVESDSLGANGQDVMTFTADETGVMPLDFESNECCDESAPGPYQFTATVTHAVVLTLPTLSTLAAKGTIDVGVANPDGVALSDPSLSVELQVHAGSQAWSTIGTASASGGSARIAYTVPASLAGKTLQLQALAQGADYQTQASDTQSVTAAASGSTGSGSGSNSGSGSSSGSGSKHGSGSNSGSKGRHGSASSSGPACVVPGLVGKKLHAATKALAGARCRLGRVRRTGAAGHEHGRVIWQSLVPGSHLRKGTKVTLVVGQ
jgi:hypothetical protein